MTEIEVLGTPEEKEFLSNWDGHWTAPEPEHTHFQAIYRVGSRYIELGHTWGFAPDRLKEEEIAAFAFSTRQQGDFMALIGFRYRTLR
jgi:hypothetical protein